MFEVGKYLLLSDIHGNLEAITSVIDSINLVEVKGIILLGDIIDYGQRSNEVIDYLETLSSNICVNIWGNHENAIMNECYNRFSSERGIKCARNTRRRLSAQSLGYINMMNKNGFESFSVGEYKCLAIHGSLEDIFWKSIEVGGVNADYSEYDYVFSGHSHLPNSFDKYYDCINLKYRNKKKTTFVNPGSVGQPRNHNPRASFAIVDFDNGTVQLLNCKYDIKKEQSFFNDSVDDFYKYRLELGV